jgi:hypothetical protein
MYIYQFGYSQIPQITLARLGGDLGVFSIIHESKEPVAVSALAAKTGAAPELLGMCNRLKRCEEAEF